MLINGTDLQAQYYVDSTFTVKINPRLSIFLVNFTMTNTDSQNNSRLIYHIKFTNIADNKLVQEVTDTSRIDSFGGLTFLDINFDKYLDFSLVTNIGPHGGYSFHYWLYNKGNNQFVRNKDFEELGGEIEIDSTKQTIDATSYWDGGCFAKSTYEIKNEKPIEIECETRMDRLDAKGNTVWYTTIEKLINGKMKIVNEYKEDQMDEE